MRLINSDDVIKAIDKHTFDTDDGLCLDDDITCILEDMPTIEPERKKGKWIPCRECLPEKSGKYLVTVQNGNVYAGTYDKYSGRFQCAATAWMELPAPYQEDD